MMSRSAVAHLCLVVAVPASLLPGQTGAQQALELLDGKCGTCHGAAQISGLDLRQREGLLKGGKRGPAVQLGRAEESLLFQAASHVGPLKMPPGSQSPLPDAELAILRDWINQGVPWPEMTAGLRRAAA